MTRRRAPSISWRPVAAALALFALLFNSYAPLFEAARLVAAPRAAEASPFEGFPICTAHGLAPAPAAAPADPGVPKPARHSSPYSCPLCPNCIHAAAPVAFLGLVPAPRFVAVRAPLARADDSVVGLAAPHAPFPPRGPPFPV